MITNKSSTKNRIQNLLSGMPKIFLVTIALLIVASPSIGHIAETDDLGCHHDHNDSYHCH